MSTKDQQRREEARHEVRRYLAERAGLAFSAETIGRKLRREFEFTDEEIRAAVVFLVSARQVEIEPDDLGATEFYRITAAGTLAHERNR